ncbi:MAG TPA: MarR family transcriptional regulator [Symbiobacteriaceae bacterium]|nr:MarR family transcriptional regulator [Symbiobacteriaceae bacterium]
MKPSLEPANRLLELFLDLFYLQPVLTMAPQDVIRLRDMLESIYPEGLPRRTESYNLLFRIGYVLSRQDENLTMGQLASALDVPLSTATRLVDWLEEGGFAVRQTDSADGRVIRVALTDPGAGFSHAITGFLVERVAQTLQEFTQEETQILTLLLSKYLAAARRQI